MRRGASYTYSPREAGRTPPISSTPSTTRPLDSMDRSDPHASSFATRGPAPPSDSDLELHTAALNVSSTASKGQQAPGFSIKKAGVGLRSMILKTVPDRFHSPRSVGNQIRRLRRHDETTIDQRHMLSAEYVSDAEKDTLKLLWKKLLLIFCHSSYGGVARVTVTNEMVDLCANDRFVRKSLQECRIEDAEVRNAFQSMEWVGSEIYSLFINSMEVDKAHDRWSEFLANRGFITQVGDSIERRCTALKGTFSVISFWAPKYLSHSLALDFKGRGLDLLLEIWEHYLNHLVEDNYCIGLSTSLREAKDFNLCVQSILSSGKSLNKFLSPSQLTARGFASYHVMHADKVPTIFTTFFALPKIKFYDLGNVISGVEFTYPPMSGWNLSHTSSYGCPFLTSAAAGVRDRRRHAELAAAGNLPTYCKKLGQGTPLGDSVFGDDTWIALYRVADDTLSNYCRGRGLSNRDGLTESTLVDILFLAQISVQLLRNNGPASSTDEAVAAFYIAQSVDIDRYWKNAVHQALQDDTTAINLLEAHSRSHNRIKVLNGLYDLTSIRLFENAPYLRRFRINGRYIVTSDYLPDPSINGSENTLDNFTVDTMLLDGHTLICLHVDDREFPFDVTGHYPILAGYDPVGEPLYVAAVRLDHIWHFTTVKEGASSVVYSDEIGDTHIAYNFFVLALRHDPSDLPPPYPNARKVAMDPTGPMFWLRFWPEKDPEYYEDARLTDDHLLGSFLNEFAAERNILSGFD